jgi:rare lipoprotein A
MHQITAAHKTLPLPTYAEVYNLQNGHKVVVKINDRGPFYQDRIIDLSYGAAKKLGLINPGIGLVRVRALNTCTSHPLARAPVRMATVKTPSPRFYLQVGAFSDRATA